MSLSPHHSFSTQMLAEIGRGFSDVVVYKEKIYSQVVQVGHACGYLSGQRLIRQLRAYFLCLCIHMISTLHTSPSLQWLRPWLIGASFSICTCPSIQIHTILHIVIDMESTCLFCWGNPHGSVSRWYTFFSVLHFDVNTCMFVSIRCLSLTHNTYTHSCWTWPPCLWLQISRWP
jgi:hypothetical protein